jgi:hypothetical protein
MGALREKMIEEIRLRNFSPRTEQSYVAAMVGLVKHYHRSPNQLTQDVSRARALESAAEAQRFHVRGPDNEEVAATEVTRTGHTSSA